MGANQHSDKTGESLLCPATDIKDISGQIKKKTKKKRDVKERKKEEKRVKRLKNPFIFRSETSFTPAANHIDFDYKNPIKSPAL